MNVPPLHERIYPGDPVSLPTCTPNKPQLSPHKITLISCGSMVQYATEANYRPPLDESGIKRVQGIVGALLYYGKDVENKLLVALSAIVSQKYSANERNSDATTQLLDYSTTDSNDGITYRTRSMVLTGHSGAFILNESKTHSRAGE